MRRAILPALLLGGLLAPAAAKAENIYVSAASTRVATSCPNTLPCTLKAGLEAADQSGDVVHVGGGSYTLNGAAEGDVATGVTVVGTSAQRPQITGDLEAFPSSAQTPTRLRHLDVAGHVWLRHEAEGSDLVVRSAAVAVRLTAAKLHQSLVVATGASTVGVEATAGGTQVTSSTVIANGAGARGIVARVSAYQSECLYQPTELMLDVRNVIARGTAGDLVASGDKAGNCHEPAAMTVAHSNFRTAVIAAENASITQGAGNQTTTELTDFSAIFAETSTYRQKVTAPTRDAGSAGTPAVPTDLDGHARVQEGAIDIGVDELPAPPRAVTGAAAEVGENAATLNGVVTPNAAETRVVFDYGPTDAYGSTTAAQVLPAGGAETAVQVRIEGLAAGTTFHFRIRAFNPEDAVQPRSAAGVAATFATLAIPPRVVVAHPLPPLPDVLAGLSAKRSLKLRTFKRKGLKVAFTLGRPATAYVVKLTARLGKRTVTLATARGTAGPGLRTIKLKPSRKTAKRLRKFKRVKAKLVVTAGTATLSRTVTIRR